ncbi:MAG: DNA repair protein RadC [Armatimonadetes bacterium]|nr:DNA repair protein RadC [Armatimonadota bacterium]
MSTNGLSPITLRVRSQGVRTSAMFDLLAVGLARRDSDVDATEASVRKWMEGLGGVRRLVDMSPQDVQEAAGLEGFDAIRALSLIEVGRRASMVGKGESDEVLSPAAVFRLLDHLRYEKKEHFVAVLLDARGMVQRVATIHVGTLTMTVVGAREVFREAIREGASSIIVSHNHPSGDPSPSPEDLDMTDKLVEVGRMLDIPVLDHVIIGERSFFSMQERGLIRGY